MRAIRYASGQVWLDERAPEARPGAGEALVRVTRAGVDEADVAICRADSAFEGILGHQLAGEVVALGEGAGDADRARWSGRRVTASPSVACARCDLCRAGLSAHCRERTVMGVDGRDGCLADLVAVPTRNLVALPDEVDEESAVLAAPLATALHAAQIIRLEGKTYVTVLGDGVTALLCAQVMQRLNASVRVLGREPARFTRCERWGVKHRHVDEAGRRQDQDVVIDCTPDGLATAMGLVRPRGKIVLVSSVGAHADGAERAVDLSRVIDDELELLGARGGSVSDAVRTLASGEAEVVSLITKRLRLTDGVAALRTAAQPEQLAVVVEA